MRAFIKVAVVILLVLLVLFIARTLELSWTTNQAVFAKGSANPLPDGLYAGTVEGPKYAWLGKKFDLASKTGINLFSTAAGSTTERYPFSFSVGRGAHDPISVIRIDYDLAANPFWLRPILDEIVEVAPGDYLGKMQARLIPGYPFTLTFFMLSLSSRT